MAKKQPIELGERVVDSITDYEGICTGILTHLNGCRRIGIQGNGLDQNHLPVDVYWVDETTVKRMAPEPKKGKSVEKEVETQQNIRGGLNTSTPKFKTPKL